MTVADAINWVLQIELREIRRIAEGIALIVLVPTFLWLAIKWTALGGEKLYLAIRDRLKAR